jgi:HlyD family type I secretion membrane fusion protein
MTTLEQRSGIRRNVAAAAGAGSRALTVSRGALTRVEDSRARRQLPVAASAQHPAEFDDMDGMGRKMLAGLVVIVAVFGGLGIWSATASLEGAIVAPGNVQVESSRKAVQHLEGGIVKDIMVRDGDKVKEGDLLIRLADKTTGANLRLVQGQVAELAIRRARLIAERENKDDLQIPGNVRLGKDDTALSQIVEGQRALLNAKRESKRGEISLLRQQQGQLRTQIAGMKEQNASKARQIEFFEDELKGVRTLFEKGLAPKGKLLTLERAAETNRGEQAALTGSIAANEMRINELELQILRLDSAGAEKVAEELRSVEAEMNANSQRLVTSQDQDERTEVRSPRTGRVYKLAVHTSGAVLKPGDTVMEIVPDDDTLIVSAKVNPQDIDKIQTGQTARVRLSAFNQRTTPELTGQVSIVSADLINDPVTGRPFYQATVSIPPDQIQRLSGLVLKPGMPAETLINTGDRSPMSYFWKPISDSFSRALKED